MADHRFAHRCEGAGQLFENLRLANAQLVVLGAVMLGDQVGVLELVTALAAGIFKANREGRQRLSTGLAEQANQQAGIYPAGEQHADIQRGAVAQAD